MKKQFFFVALLIAMAMSLGTTPEAQSQLIVTVGEGTFVQLDNPWGQWNWRNSRRAAIYSEHRIEEAGGGPGLINRIEWETGPNNPNPNDWRNNFYGPNANVEVLLGISESPNFPRNFNMNFNMFMGVTPNANIQIRDIQSVYQGEGFRDGFLEPFSWQGLDLQDPYVYTGGNLVVMIRDDRTFTLNNSGGQWRFTRIFGNPPAEDNTEFTSWVTGRNSPAQAEGANAWGNRNNANVRLHILQGIEESFPDGVDPRRILRAKELYDGSSESNPHPSITFRQALGTPVEYDYSIRGPLATNPFDTIYHSDNGVGGHVITYDPDGNGLTTVDVPNAVGSAAGPDGALDLANAEGGQYQLLVFFSTPFQEQEWRQNFLITFQNDMAVAGVIAPFDNNPPRLFKYPRASTVPMSGRFQNVGLNNVTNFRGIATVINPQGEEIYRDTVENPNVNLATGDVVVLDFNNFVGAQEVGVYTACFEVELLSADDEGIRNNKTCVEFTVEHDVQAVAKAILRPEGGAEFKSGRPIQPAGVITNVGIQDLSDVPVTMEIFPANGNTPVYSSEKLIPNLPNGSQDVFFNEFDIWEVSVPSGEYRAVMTVSALDDAVEEDNSITIFFTVEGRLSGDYLVGNSSPDFLTIQDAVDALFICGVEGPVNFILTDQHYTEGSLDVTGPALDFRTHMIGVSADNPVRFIPSPTRALTKGGVTITLKSRDGIGMWFGQTLNPENFNAIINEFPNDANRVRLYANSSGYITFDGLRNKSIRIQLESGPDPTFNTPIFVGRGASNYAFRNLLIQNAPGQKPNYGTTIPLQEYSRSQFKFTYEPDEDYTAGVVIRNTVPVNRIGNNSENLDTNRNVNNMIYGCEIRGFGYGVVNLGAGVLFTNEDSKFTPFYNENTVISENLIWDVARAGVYVGFENGGTVAHNRIYNVGDIGGYNGGASGIRAGGDTWYHNESLRINGNEISNVRSDVYASGITVEQTLNRYFDLAGGGEPIDFPSTRSQMHTINNMVWDMQRTDGDAHMMGIIYQTSRDLTAEDVELTPEHLDFWTQGDFIANNTIVHRNDGIRGDGSSIMGIGLQQSRAPRVLNNAIAVMTPANAVDGGVHAALFNQGVDPRVNGGVISNRNAFHTPNSSLAYLVEVTAENEIIDFGANEQFENLGQWQALTNQDNNSVVGNFFNDMAIVGGQPQSLRIRTTPTLPVGSILNNRGQILNEVTEDIGGQIRGAAEQRYDIGADEFNGSLLLNDIEANLIIEPRQYRRTEGPFSEAEYIVTERPVKVRALLRNNGSISQSGVNITATVWVETAASNNTFANSNGPIFPAGDYVTQVVTQSRPISANEGETVEVEFDFSNVIGQFEPQTYHELGAAYTVPDQFMPMYRNVTPRYRIVVETISDQNIVNNRVEKEMRFYVYRSHLGIMATISGATHVDPVALDAIADKVNSDSLLQGLNDLAWTYENTDFDIMDRDGWEPYAQEYELYKTVMWSQGNAKLTRLERTGIRNFLNSGDLDDVHNLLIAGQEIPRNHIGASVIDDQAFVNQVLGVQLVDPGTPADPDYDGKRVGGKNIAGKHQEVVASTEYNGDVAPVPALLSLFSDPDASGVQVPSVAYVYLEPDAGLTTDVMGSAVSAALRSNVVFYGVDWRHWGRLEGQERLSGTQRVLRGALDFFDSNGGSVRPVELAYFDAYRIANTSVQVEWETASELNSARFDVERKLRGDSEFEYLTSVNAQGTSTEPVQYSSIDNRVSAGNVYVYRLRMIDLDGSEAYSQEVEVDLGSGSEVGGVWLGQSAPNPARDEATMPFSLSEGGEVSYELYAADGSRVQQVQMGYVESGRQEAKLNLRTVPSGTYLFVLNVNGVRLDASIRVVK